MVILTRCSFVWLMVLVQPLESDYLKTLEMGDELRAHGAAFRPLTFRTFGEEFGDKLMTLVGKMLARDPRARPNPTECIAALTS
jgi:hypothetical protein